MPLSLRRIAANSSWFVGQQAISVPLLFVESLVLARLLGPEQFGTFVLVMAFPEAVQMILDCRTREAITRYLGESRALGDPEFGDAVFRFALLVNLAVGVTAFLIVSAGASVAATYIVKNAALAGLIVLAGLGRLLASLDSGSGAVMRVFGEYALSAKIGAATVVARFVATLAGALITRSVFGAVLGRTVAEGLRSALLAVPSYRLLHRHTGFRLFGPLDAMRRRTREISLYLLHTNLSGTLKLASDKGIVLIVGLIGGPTAAGLYKIAAQVGTSPLLVTDAAYAALFPEYAYVVAQGDRAAAEHLGRRLTKYMALPVAALIGLYALVARPFVSLVFGAGFEAAAVPSLLVVAGVALSMLGFWIRPLLLALDKTRALVFVGLAAVLLQYAVTACLMPALGVLGAALGLGLFHIVYVILEWRVLRQA